MPKKTERRPETPAEYDPRKFPPFAVTVDLVILTIRDGALCVLLVERQESPFSGLLALPGGFVGSEIDLLESATTTLVAKTGVKLDTVHLEQLGTYGEPNRDPRMRVVSVAYLAFAANLPDPVGDLAERARWTLISDLPGAGLAFDHEGILDDALERARSRIEYTSLASCFCAPEFTMAELRAVFEAVWGTRLDPANFDRKIRATEQFVVETGNSRKQPKGRPARTYRQGTARELFPPIRRGS